MISPTLSMHATQAGMILGTAAYMAPEQARGRPCDKRADIWAFGVVLYEMLTGARLFEGETVSDTLAQVLTKAAGFDAGAGPGPAAARRLSREGSEARLHAMGDAPLLLDESPSADAGSRTRTMAATVPAMGRRDRMPCRRARRGRHPLQGSRAAGRAQCQLSDPTTREIDGEHVQALARTDAHLVVVVNEVGRSRLWIRRLDLLVAQHDSWYRRRKLPVLVSRQRLYRFRG